MSQSSKQRQKKQRRRDFHPPSSLALRWRSLTSKLKQKWQQFKDWLRSLTSSQSKTSASRGPTTQSPKSKPTKTRNWLNISVSVATRLIKLLVIVFLAGGTIAVGTGLGYFARLVKESPAPTREEMSEQIHRFEQQSTLYYADGSAIADISADVVRTVTALEDVSDYIVDGLIATEDEYFYEHPGIVPKALIRAVLQEIFMTGGGTGGSTLTQQLVKQQMLTHDVTFSRKANEILLSLRLENHFDKDEILTAYLNVSPFGRNRFGENIAGIEQAAQGIFGVSAKDVNLPQAAFLVGLPQDPYRYTPYENVGQLRTDLTPGIDRMQEVLFRMYRSQYIDYQTYQEALAYDITSDFLSGEYSGEERLSYLYQAMTNSAIETLMRVNIEADRLTWEQVASDDEWYNDYYFAAQEELRTGGYRIYTTIEKDIYDQMQQSARDYSDQLGRQYEGIYTDPETGYEEYFVESVQVGMVAIENATGRVLGFVSGTDFENNQIDHAFGIRRSPGSTIKPLAVYAPAIEHNLIAPATIIPDTPFVIEYEDGSVWAPTNYGESISNELISARKALYKSDNIPAVRIYHQLLERRIPVIDYLEKMGFDTQNTYTQEDVNNLAFSLGGVTTGPTVFEETRAFTTFANDGEYIEGYSIERIETADGQVIYQQEHQPVRVFSPETNYLVLDMLRDTLTQGTGRIAKGYLTMEGDWIMKSGISENSKDVWTIASTPKITIGSWIGYDSHYGDYTIDLNDGFGGESQRSQYHWAHVVNDLYQLRPDIFGIEQTFKQPASVERTAVLEQTGTLPGMIRYEGNQYRLMEPLYEDLFKKEFPARELVYDFIFDGDEEITRQFWTNYSLRLQEHLRQQQRPSTDEEETQDNDNEQETESLEDELTSDGLNEFGDN